MSPPSQLNGSGPSDLSSTPSTVHRLGGGRGEGGGGRGEGGGGRSVLV